MIPARNAANTISAQLDALSEQVDSPEFEVIVADNGSTDGTSEILHGHRDSLPHLRVVDASRRRGVSAARNAGVEAACGDHILICDADDTVAPQWVAALSSSLTSWDLVGGPLDERSLNDPTVMHVRTPLPSTRLPIAGGFLPYAVGCNMGFRRSVWESIGGFDETWPRGGEDVEFCWRAQLAGCDIGFAESALVRYRYRSGVQETVRQLQTYAEAQARLYRQFRVHGMPRSRPSAAAKGWLWLALRAPDLRRDPERRGAWLRRYATRSGFLRGSVHQRVLYL